MEGIAITDPVPAVEEPEITSATTTGPGPAEPTVSDGGGGGDGSATSCPWSLTHEQQVFNFKENWKRAFNWTDSRSVWETEDKFDTTNPWFESVVAKVRVDPSCDELQVDQSLGGLFGSRFRMISLDVAILMGDLKMVQDILQRSSHPNNLVNGSLVSRERASELFFIGRSKVYFLYTPLHLTVVGGDSHIVDELLERGADVNAQNWLSQTPLDVACKMQNVTLLQQLLAKVREMKDPLHVAMLHGNVDFIKKLPSLKVNAMDIYGRTPMHYLATKRYIWFDGRAIVQYLAQDKSLDVKALDACGTSAFYVAVFHCNTQMVLTLLESFKEQIRVNEVCIEDLGPPIQIAFEGGDSFGDIERALMECEPVKGYMERLYRDRQVYMDAADAILVGAALIASVTFVSWLQPPLNYTSYSGERYSSSVHAPSTSNLNYVDVEHNIALRAFWVFNALSFYFAIGTVVCGARSVLPRSHLFIEKTVEKLRTNLLVTSILLACLVLFVIIAFVIAGTIVLTPLVKYQWYMIVPTLVGGMVCIVSLGFLVKSMKEIYSYTRENSKVLGEVKELWKNGDLRFVQRV